MWDLLTLFDTLLLSDVLIQKSEGYILEAPKAEREDLGAGPSMDTIFKGLAEAKQKEENFKKRQVGFGIMDGGCDHTHFIFQELKELERIIAEREGGQSTKRFIVKPNILGEYQKYSTLDKRDNRSKVSVVPLVQYPTYRIFFQSIFGLKIMGGH